MGPFHSPPTPPRQGISHTGPSPLCHQGTPGLGGTNWGSWDICRDMMGWSRISIQHAVGKMEKGKLPELKKHPAHTAPTLRLSGNKEVSSQLYPSELVNQNSAG